VKSIVKEQYPDAEKAVLGKDNANLRFEELAYRAVAV
jgi:hypothetical protein